MANPSTDDEIDHYSPSSTVISFDPPLPLLRGPLPAGDESSGGPYVLAFRNTESWAIAYKDTKSKLIQQCEAGSRIGCSISASSNCKPPWWKFLFSGGVEDFAERERCEEREIERCLDAAKGNCEKYAENKCGMAFRDARIAVVKDRKTNWKEASKVILWSSLPLTASLLLDLYRVDDSWNEFRSRVEVTSFRGNDYLKLKSESESVITEENGDKQK
ncbi:uncharacterized protein LOC124912303 [Impatiens glandulifera]|uniref:uncharacterized protein LOC124912303 n=1 Tax=Impatiens glandulifera TaxID=253017 RepID=UPI001FB05110|nr:uncharacterized protein LOC124912303 [Impatiens glandulifera]